MCKQGAWTPPSNSARCCWACIYVWRPLEENDCNSCYSCQRSEFVLFSLLWHQTRVLQVFGQSTAAVDGCERQRGVSHKSCAVLSFPFVPCSCYLFHVLGSWETCNFFFSGLWLVSYAAMGFHISCYGLVKHVS